MLGCEERGETERLKLDGALEGALNLRRCCGLRFIFSDLNAVSAIPLRERERARREPRGRRAEALAERAGGGVGAGRSGRAAPLKILRR